MSKPDGQMRFDEAFDLLVEYCANAAPGLIAASGHHGRSSRTNSYGNDIWIAHVVRGYWARRVDPNTLSEEQFVPFYDAAWELCRIGVLRPGQHAAMGQGQIGGAIFNGDGYSITEFGAKGLADPERQTSADPSRMSEIFGSFSETYGTGFSQRATEAIRCHRTSNYLASCVMAGAAAESILLAVAIAKAKDEEKVLKTYEKSGGRLAVTRLALQLQLIEGSESMGDHDSGSDDWWCVG
jgi:hypothetical protein